MDPTHMTIQIERPEKRKIVVPLAGLEIHISEPDQALRDELAHLNLPVTTGYRVFVHGQARGYISANEHNRICTVLKYVH